MDIVFTNNEVDQHTTSFFPRLYNLLVKDPNSGSGISHFNPPLDLLINLSSKLDTMTILSLF